MHGSGTIYYFYDNGITIGYDQGKPTSWIRAELTSRTLHGHPMSTDRVNKYTNQEIL